MIMDPHTADTNVTEQDLLYRKEFWFRKNPMFTLDSRAQFSNVAGDLQVEIKLGWLISMDGYKHAFVIAPSMRFTFFSIIDGVELMNTLSKISDGIHMEWGNEDSLMNERGSLRSIPFTIKVFLFVGCLHEDRECIRKNFRRFGLEPVIVDNER
jgi:hypothetical protein